MAAQKYYRVAVWRPLFLVICIYKLAGTNDAMLYSNRIIAADAHSNGAA